VTNVPRWRRYLRFFRPDVSGDVDDELAFHLLMRAERNRALGMDTDVAAHDAQARFGDVATVRQTLIAHDLGRERTRGRREAFGDLLQDARFGLRSLRRSPGFATAAIVTLALSIGATSAMFSVVEAVLLRPLPFAHPETLVSLGTASAGEYAALAERLRSFSGLGLVTDAVHPVTIGTETSRLEGAAVTVNLFPLLGAAPALGRNFERAEGEVGRNDALIISDALWHRAFGGGQVLGAHVLVEGQPFTVVGVMPAGFAYPHRHVDYWQPFAIDRSNPGYVWGANGHTIVGRLARGATLASARREVAAVWPTIRHLNPLWDPGPDYGTGTQVTPLARSIVGATGPVVWLLFACVLLVLVIGCVNVANLLLARATARHRELTLRAVLGGGRGRLIKQLLTESLMLSGLGAVAGVGVAWGLVRWLAAAVPANVPRAEGIGLDGMTVAFSAAVAIVVGLLFGILPAIRATGTADASVHTAARATRGRSQHQIAELLVSGQLALAVMLVIGAALLARSLYTLRQVNPGFAAEHIIAARITPPAEGFRDSTRLAALYDPVLDRVGHLPGVTSAATVSKLPLGGEPVWGMAVRVAGQFEDGTHVLPEIAHLQSVSPEYFATMRIPVVRGRAFTTADGPRSAPVVVVSASTARKFWPGGDAVGHQLGYPFPSPWMTIVGVVADVRQDSLRDTSMTSIYMPAAQRSRLEGPEMWVVARTTADPAAVAAAIREAVRSVSPEVAVGDLRTMDTIVSASVQNARFTTVLLCAFALAALLLGAVGIYGVTSYLVGQRTREISLRLALGATPRQVVETVVRRATLVAAGGAVVGVLGALASTRALRAMLVGVTARDPATFVAVPLILLLVAVAASWAPARRAAGVDPASSLHGDS